MHGGFFMDIWHLRGGNRLEGSCFVQGSKNASLPIIAAGVAIAGLIMTTATYGLLSVFFS